MSSIYHGQSTRMMTYASYKTSFVTEKYLDLLPVVKHRGLLSQFSLLRYFPNFSALLKHILPTWYHVYIWQVSPQLSCGDTCQIWMGFNKSNSNFCKIENFAYREINERSFSNPTPGSLSQSSHNLEIERGRYVRPRLKPEQCRCFVCNVMDDEINSVTQCRISACERRIIYQKISFADPRFTSLNDKENNIYLMQSNE